jgi:hypothetical protein
MSVYESSLEDAPPNGSGNWTDAVGQGPHLAPDKALQSCSQISYICSQYEIT